MFKVYQTKKESITEKPDVNGLHVWNFRQGALSSVIQCRDSQTQQKCQAYLYRTAEFGWIKRK